MAWPPSHRHARIAAGARPGAAGRRRAARRARLGRGRDRDRADHHLGRHDPGPAARRGRRQGAVDQGARRLPRSTAAPILSVHSMKDVETIRPDGAGDRGDAGAGRHARPADRRRQPRCSAARARGSAPRRRAGPRNCWRGGPISTAPRSAATSRPGWPRSRRGEFDATLLAAAGLDRLGIAAGVPLDLLPAPAQGAIGVEILAGRDDLRALLARDRPCADPRSGGRRARLPRRAGRRLPFRRRRAARRGGAGRRPRSSAPTARGAGRAKARPPTLARDLLARASPALRAMFGR